MIFCVIIKSFEQISLSSIPVGIYLLKDNNRNTRTRCEIFSNLTIKTPLANDRLGSLRLFGKENMSPLFNFIESIEKLTFRPTSLNCPSDTKLVFLSFFSDNAAMHWKIVLTSLSPTFTCNLTPYIKLPGYVRTSCWRAKSILMSGRQNI